MDSFVLPRLYAIADANVLAIHAMPLDAFARTLRAAGISLVQYRDKTSSPQEILRAAAILRSTFAGSSTQLIMNDRADLAVLAEYDGVHVGQGDLSAIDARVVVGPKRIVGISTHNDEQIRAANASCADYLAIGPVFATETKENPDPVVGLEGIRRVRTLTNKPLVAIGGITRKNARSVLDAGADSVAVISGLFASGERLEQVTRDFLAILG